MLTVVITNSGATAVRTGTGTYRRLAADSVRNRDVPHRIVHICRVRLRQIAVCTATIFRGTKIINIILHLS